MAYDKEYYKIKLLELKNAVEKFNNKISESKENLPAKDRGLVDEVDTLNINLSGKISDKEKAHTPAPKILKDVSADADNLVNVAKSKAEELLLRLGGEKADPADKMLDAWWDMLALQEKVSEALEERPLSPVEQIRKEFDEKRGVKRFREEGEEVEGPAAKKPSQ